MSETKDAPKVTYSVNEAIRATGYGRTRLYELMAAVKFDARKDGKKTVITAESINNYIASLPRFSSTRTMAA
jgi:hypothetical protein